MKLKLRSRLISFLIRLGLARLVQSWRNPNTEILSQLISVTYWLCCIQWDCGVLFLPLLINWTIIFSVDHFVQQTCCFSQPKMMQSNDQLIFYLAANGSKRYDIFELWNCTFLSPKFLICMWKLCKKKTSKWTLSSTVSEVNKETFVPVRGHPRPNPAFFSFLMFVSHVFQFAPLVGGDASSVWWTYTKMPHQRWCSPWTTGFSVELDRENLWYLTCEDGILFLSLFFF